MRIVAMLAFGAGLIGMSGAMAAGSKPGGFNGVWSVQLVTESGICDRSLNYAIVVDKGQVRPVQASDATVTGRIGPDGNVAIGVHRAMAKADVSGRLQANSGAGVWQVAAIGCSGRWTAHRRTATADRDS